MSTESRPDQALQPPDPPDRSIPWTAALKFALFAAVLNYAFNFIWEISAGPLYAAPHGTQFKMGLSFYFLICLRASAGDVAITLVSYLLAASVNRDVAWLFRRFGHRLFGALAVWLISGLLITAWLEHEALATGRWAYGPLMPTLGGIGVAPLLQWVVVPLVWLWILRPNRLGRIWLELPVQVASNGFRRNH